MFIESLEVTQYNIDVITKSIGILQVITSLLLFIDKIGMLERFINVRLAVIHTQRQVGFQFQALDNIILHSKIIQKTIAGRLVFGRQYGIIQLILHLLGMIPQIIITILIQNPFDITIFIIRIVIWIIAQIRTEISIRRIYGFQMVERSVIRKLQIFQIVLQPDASPVIVTFRTFHYACLIGIVKVKRITEHFIPAFCRDGMFVSDTDLFHGNSQPIHIISHFHQFQLLIISIQIIIRPPRSGRRSIQSCPQLILQLFLRIHQIIIGKVRHLEIDTSVIRQLQFACFRNNGLYDNHTIGGTRTVNSRSGSIFQYRYESDSRRI